MRRTAFSNIFWGLLFVVLDIRLGAIDLILPDFVGYILIFQGLTLLAPEHHAFRKARVLAAVMVFVSLPGFFGMGSLDPAFLRRQLISGLTGDLSALLPREVRSARLLRTTNSRSSIDANRTRNPQREEDAVLGEYSDGTTVLILRYASPEEALQALNDKREADYSSAGIRKRAETDESFKVDRMSESHSTSGSDGSRVSEASSVDIADRRILQWWNRRWTWWNLSDGNHKGGWSGSILYIVEGYGASAAAYKSAFEGERQDKSGITVNPLFPLSVIGEVLDAMMIWAICSGIMALSLSLNQYDLMNTARQRRALYLALIATGWVFSTIGLIAPKLMSGLVQPVLAGGLVVYAVVVMIAVVLIMALMRRAANSL
ncbi:MAG TPA: hypothetical protein VF432_21315 [Thermoanaerobaculia bacterium]